MTLGGLADMKWGSAYLTPDFFQELGTTMGEHVLLVVAQEGDEDSPLVAGALNLIGSDAIYGRNWGCAYSCRVKHLHFELCYYQVRPLGSAMISTQPDQCMRREG